MSTWQLDYIDSYNLILRGKIGIFYPDAYRLKIIDAMHVVNCAEKEAKKLLYK